MKAKIFLLSVFVFLSLTACNYPGPTTSIPCDVNFLIKAILDANQLPDIDTFELAPGCIYELVEVNIVKDGNNGLPIIESPIVINGNGATIRRSESAPAFRLMYIVAPGNLDLHDLTLSNGNIDHDGNSSPAGYGGAILNFGRLEVNNTLITKNYAHTGSAIQNQGSADIKNSTISHNKVNIQGAINNYGEHMTISHSLVTGHNWYGVNNYEGILQITNSTLSGNYIGVSNDDPGHVSLEFVTFSNNSLGINSVSGSVTIRNSLFGPHLSKVCGVGPNILTSLDANIDTDGTCKVITVPAHSLVLGPLADNGGPTFTHALGEGSVAIDAAIGDCPVNDQRGVHRPKGAACDVGAYEYDGEFERPTSTHTALPDSRGTSTFTPTSSPTSTPTSTSTVTASSTATLTPTQEDCTFTASANLFCRSGPGSSIYPEIDTFTPGQSGPVFGLSPDGFFAQVEGGNNHVPCYVPLDERYGTLSGYCDDLPVLAPPPTPTPSPSPTPSHTPPIQGCTVRQPGGAIECVAPCPANAAPGDACTMP